MTVATSGDKGEGLLPSRRISNVYDANVLSSTQGVTTVRILALAAGMGFIACTTQSWISWILQHHFSFLELAVSITNLGVGICSFLLESNFSFCEGLKQKLISKAAPLGQVSGRGSMYAAAGLIQCAVFHALHLLVGLFAAAVGVYMIQVGNKAIESINTLRTSITDENALLEAFQSNDWNGDGVLEMFEFDGLILALGIELDSDELDAAFCAIDTNNDKKIVYDEFRVWWKECTSEAEVGIL